MIGGQNIIFWCRQRVLSRLKYSKIVGGRSSAPDPGEATHDATQDPLVVREGQSLSQTPPLRRPWRLNSRVSRLRRSISAYGHFSFYKLTTVYCAHLSSVLFTARRVRISLPCCFLRLFVRSFVCSTLQLNTFGQSQVFANFNRFVRYIYK